MSYIINIHTPQITKIYVSFWNISFEVLFRHVHLKHKLKVFIKKSVNYEKVSNIWSHISTSNLASSMRWKGEWKVSGKLRLRANTEGNRPADDRILHKTYKLFNGKKLISSEKRYYSEFFFNNITEFSLFSQ